MNVSSASTIPDQAFRLVLVESGKKSMTPPERRRVIYRATLRRLSNGSSASQGSRLIDPAILVMQSGQGRPRQRSERLSASLAAIPRHAVRAAPGADREIAAMRTTRTQRSDRARPLKAVPVRASPRQWARRPRPPSRPAARFPRFRHPDVRSDRRLRPTPNRKTPTPVGPPSEPDLGSPSHERPAMSIPTSKSQRAI